MLGRAGVELGRVRPVAGALVVLGRERPGSRWRAGRVRPGAPATARPWHAAYALVALEHRVVGHLVQDLVAEGVFAQAVERTRRRAAAPARARTSEGSCSAGLRVDGRPAPGPRTPRRSTLACCSARFSCARQAVQPRLQHAGQRGRHLGHEQPLGVERPALRPVRIAPWSMSMLAPALPCRRGCLRRRR